LQVLSHRQDHEYGTLRKKIPGRGDLLKYYYTNLRMNDDNISDIVIEY
jgi:hypothetical protein